MIPARTVRVVRSLSGMLLRVKFRWRQASRNDQEIINLIVILYMSILSSYVMWKPSH